MKALDKSDFGDILDSLKPKIGNYDWMWKFLAARAKQKRAFPSRLYPRLMRWGDPRKPYSICKAASGILFLGDYRDRWSAHYAIFPNFDDSVANSILARMKRSDGICLDIGANMGVMAATIAKGLDNRSEVIAFEPLAATVRRAAATFALNKLTNIRLLPIALGDQDGDIKFYDAPGMSEGASANPTDFSDQGVKIDWQEIKVPCRRLDTIMTEYDLPKVSAIKLDVEGNEYKTMQGGIKLLQRDSPMVLYEYFPHVAHSSGWRPADMQAVFSKSGPYQYEVLHEDNSITPYPPSSESEIVNIICHGRIC